MWEHFNLPIFSFTSGTEVIPPGWTDLSEITFFFVCVAVVDRMKSVIFDQCTDYSELPLKRVLRVRKANSTLCSMALVSKVA